MPKPPRAAREPLFFDDAAAFRRWLEKNHATETELLVGFLKKKPGRTSLTYFEALDEALCFGWIDGVKRSLDDGPLLPALLAAHGRGASGASSTSARSSP